MPWNRAWCRYKLLDDTLNIVCPDGEVPDIRRRVAEPPAKDTGSFELLFDETIASAVDRDRPTKNKRQSSTWK